MTVVTRIDKDIRTTHTVEIRIAEAPLMETHNHYYHGEMYTPDRLVVVWSHGEEARQINVSGLSMSNSVVRRSFGLKQAPEWMKLAVQESIAEAETWTWEW